MTEPSLFPGPSSAAAPATIVFCDLDGTLVLDNSFHVFLACFWSSGGLRPRVALLLALAPRLFGRLSGGHAGLKRRVLKAFARQGAVWRRKVIGATLAKLGATRSGPVVAALEAWRARGARLVLATAAPDIYARPLAGAMGMECIATPGEVSPGWRELLAARKAEACRRCLGAGGRPRVVVLTDHADDLPLLSLADDSLVQAAPARYARIAEALGAAQEGARPGHIDPVAAQDGGGYWLWLDDRPHGPLDLWELRTILSKHRHAMLYVGAGRWRRIGPGQPVDDAVLRRDCPLPPSSGHRLVAHLRRRILRDWLGIFH